VGTDISEEDVPPFASSETGLILLASQEEGGHDILNQVEEVKKGTQSKSEERNG
jgi:hypothetical protein